jgi:hypothetical protein
LKRCGSNTSRYIEPENIVMPAVKRPMASVFCGATTDAKVRTAEWMSWGGGVSVMSFGERDGGKGRADLVLCCCAPVGNARWVCDAFLEAVGAEGAEHDA